MILSRLGDLKVESIDLEDFANLDEGRTFARSVSEGFIILQSREGVAICAPDGRCLLFT